MGEKIYVSYYSNCGLCYSNLVNLDNHVGACGFIPVHPFVKYLYPVQLLKMDDNTGEILRGPDGFCVLCKPGESGHMVGTIMRNQPLLRYYGSFEMTFLYIFPTFVR